MKIKKIISVGLTIIMIGMSTTTAIPVSAKSLLEEVSETETTDTQAQDISYSLLRGNNLIFGSVKISKLASNKINIYGLTQCHHECDTVYLYLYLEQKVDGSYSTYKNWKFTDNNVTSMDRSLNVIVPSGHYYRVRGYHAAKDGAKESTETLTQGILVN